VYCQMADYLEEVVRDLRRAPSPVPDRVPKDSEMTKRTLDIMFSAAGLFVLSPILVLACVLIKLSSRGPAFYRGERIGRDARPFRILKLRTMVADAEALGGSSTAADDRRITWVGRIMRKTKLDELPQLINVLRGDMSLVGPRPQVRWGVDLYSDEERALLTVR